MQPAKYDLSLWIGNTETLKFRFLQTDDTGFDLTGSTLILTIRHDGGTLTKSSADDGVWDLSDGVNGFASIVISAAETRAIVAVKAPARYEIERRIGSEQRTLLRGRVLLKGGDNGD